MKNILFPIVIAAFLFTANSRAEAPPQNAFAQSVQNCMDIYKTDFDFYMTDECMGGASEAMRALAENPTNSRQALTTANQRCEGPNHWAPSLVIACKVGVTFYFSNSGKFTKE